MKVIAGGCAGLILSFGAYILLPGEASLAGAVILNFFIGLVLIYAVRSQYFAVHDDAGIPLHLSGRVSGIASALGYMPDVFMYTLVGGWMDSLWKNRLQHDMGLCNGCWCPLYCIDLYP